MHRLISFDLSSFQPVRERDVAGTTHHVGTAHVQADAYVYSLLRRSLYNV